MKFTKVLTALIVILASQIAQADNDVKEGGKLYRTHCAACHGTSGGMDMSKRVAPHRSQDALHRRLSRQEVICCCCSKLGRKAGRKQDLDARCDTQF